MSQIPKNACFIYVFGDLDQKYAKLGKTRKRAELRMHQHETRGPTTVEMRLLAVMYGHEADEGALKNHWKSIVVEGTKEWVTPTESFKSWLRFLRQQPFVARTFDEIDAISFVDSRHWLPSRMNQFSKTQGRLNFNTDPWADLDFDEEGEGDFYTGPPIIEAARQTLGGSIDLDPASCRLANTVVRATRFFPALQDGLTQKWEGRVWLNPPFGQWEFWAPKLLHELEVGNVTQACLLVPSRAVTARACHLLIRRSQAVVIPNGRFKFWGPKAGTPDEGHFIFYFGPNIDAFTSAFQPIGPTFIHHLSAVEVEVAA